MTDPQHGEHAHMWPGVPLALASAVLFGATPIASKALLAEISPVLLAGLLYLGAGVGLWGLDRLARLAGSRTESGPDLSRADLPWLAAAILAGGVVAPILLMFGLARTTAANGALLLNLEGLATMAIAWIVFRENVDRRLFVGAMAILAGAVLLSWTGEGVSIDGGGLLVAGACLAWGLDNNLTRKVAAASPVRITVWKGLVAGGVDVAIAAATGDPWPPVAGTAAAAAAVVGFFGVGVSLVFFIAALRHLGSARTGAYFSLAPFVGAGLAVVVLGDAVTAKLAAAAALMGLGLWLHLTERHEHEHAHAETEHDHVHRHDAHHHHDHDGPVEEPHAHPHRHAPLVHRHVHYPDIHHRHGH